MNTPTSPTALKMETTKHALSLSDKLMENGSPPLASSSLTGLVVSALMARMFTDSSSGVNIFYFLMVSDL
jgi:hypothetical protein